MIPGRCMTALLLLSTGLGLAAPATWAAEDVPAYEGGAAIPSSDYHDIYRGYLGMSEEQIASIPWYQSTYSLAEDDCLAIAIIAHAASRPFATAVADFVGPCHRSLAELMRSYSVPTEVLFVQAPQTEVYPVYYQRLYEPFWGGYCDRVVYSNSDCCALFAFRVSTEFWRCPPPLFFDRCVAYRSPAWALRRERTWWSPPAGRMAMPLPARELRRPAPLPPQHIIAGGERGAPRHPASGAVGGSSAGTVPPASRQERRASGESPGHAPSPEAAASPDRRPAFQSAAPNHPVIEPRRSPQEEHPAPSHPVVEPRQPRREEHVAPSHPQVAAPRAEAPPAMEHHQSYGSQPMAPSHASVGSRGIERRERSPGQ